MVSSTYAHPSNLDEMPEFRLTNVAYTFPGFDFGPLSVVWSPGQVYGLLGANGAGKTTLLNLVTHQLRLESGTMSYGGWEPAWGDPKWKARFTYISETPAFYDELTVRDILRFAGKIHDRWDAQLASRLVTRLELDPSKKVSHLSKGNRVKLGLVAGMAAHAELILLDEPTAGLDPSVRIEVHQILTDLMSEQNGHLCIVLSSHIFEDLEKVADNVSILKNGSLAFSATRDEVERLTMFRCSGHVEEELIKDVPLRWEKDNNQWLLIPRTGRLATTLARRAEWTEARPQRILEAVYHGVQRSTK